MQLQDTGGRHLHVDEVFRRRTDARADTSTLKGGREIEGYRSIFTDICVYIYLCVYIYIYEVFRRRTDRKSVV